MPRRSPTIWSVTPAPRVADSHPPKRRSLRAVKAGDGGDGFGECGGGGVRVRESADGAVDGDELEGDFLGDGHHDLLELGLGAEGDEPEFAAGIFGGEGGGFVESARGPRVEDGGQHHFVFKSGASWPCGRFQCLQGVGGDSGADDDVECCWHFVSSGAFSFQLSAFSFFVATVSFAMNDPSILETSSLRDSALSNALPSPISSCLATSQLSLEFEYRSLRDTQKLTELCWVQPASAFSYVACDGDTGSAHLRSQAVHFFFGE